VAAPRIVTITATHLDDAMLAATASVTLLPALSVFHASRPVSVTAAPAPLAIHDTVGAILSVLRAAPRMLSSTSTPVFVAIEPVVTAVVPARAATGETVAMTLSGRGLADAVSLVLLRNGAVDHQIRVANFGVNSAGTQATADVSVDAAAPAGPRVVQVATSTRTSSPVGSGGNIFTLQ
jgi:hypothetical protein